MGIKQMDANTLLKEAQKANCSDEHLAFISAWLSNFPLDEFCSRKVDNVAGWLVDLAHQHVGRSDDYIRVYNPTIERNRWQAANSVVVISFSDLPFVIDSIRIALGVIGIEVRLLHSHVFVSDTSRSLAYIEVGRREKAEELSAIAEALDNTLSSVKNVVDAFPSMQEQVKTLVVNYEKKFAGDPAHDFLDWLRREHFIFLGYGEWCDGQITRTLGTTKDNSDDDDLVSVPILIEGENIAFSKSSSRSQIHRHVYSDYVVIRDPKRPKVEHRFVGLFTSSVYHQNPSLIPVVRDKIAYVLDKANLPSNSHDGKVLDQILANYPTDELFISSPEELYSGVNRALRIQERPIVRVSIRRGRLGRFVNCLVYVPRDRYNTELRKNIQKYLSDELNAVDSEFTTYFSGGNHARVHFILRTASNERRDVDLTNLEDTILDMCREWPDRLRDTLCETLGDDVGSRLASLYLGAFPAAYRDDYDTRFAGRDIVTIDEMANDQSMAVSFYQRVGDADNAARFRVFRFDTPIGLSEVLPKFENLGWYVLGEHPYEIDRRDGERVWLHEYRILVEGLSGEKIERNATLCQEAFEAVWRGDAEDDRFNRLVLRAGLSWQQVAILRSYARYMFQIQFGFSLDYIADTLSEHSEVATQLVDLFEAIFDPERAADELSNIDDKLQTLRAEIDQVESLDEDRILRRYLDLIMGTERTNYYRPTLSGQERSVLSFKLNTRRIPDLPKPTPYFEIFVCSPRTEGVHLRGGPVARGGLRWSDRFEDYRTEVLGLVKAQQVKNSVIVPVGAKGGFVARKTDSTWSRDRFLEEGIACYKEFISGLLDITDNRSGEEIVSPPAVICRDESDPYLVVAADKGTATFSDIANGLANDYGFWLGDAFASGGSQGYDHKKMGITAKGAWVSVQRHFREMGIDVQSDPVTVLGIGDMSGDVFGNGMLLSSSLKVVAAFNHRHIFIDPNPNPAKSFKERQRLFELPRSGWDDYNTKLISKGGGVFSRGAKVIKISKEMKTLFAIEESELRPTELLERLLKAPIDLLWNGGIGTYVKASTESHSDVGDKANDTIRVNGVDLGARVVGEGGNLGLTQLGRVEYSVEGGRCNTDFIDNAGGVDCSDHEVNIKILLNQLTRDGAMSELQRNELLESMTDQVSSLVLHNNALQAQAISLESLRSTYRSGDHRRFIIDLESINVLDRELEFLPSEADIQTRIHEREQALSRPELSILLSYAKSELKRHFARPKLITGQYRKAMVQSAFPKILSDKFPEQIEDHQLNTEIVATQMANEIVNFMGITFVHRLRKSTGAGYQAIARAWIFCREVFSLDALWDDIAALGSNVDSTALLEQLDRERRMVRRAARWYIHNRRTSKDVEADIQSFKDEVSRLIEQLPHYLSTRQQSKWTKRYNAMISANVPEKLATRCAATDYLFAMLSICDVASETETDSVLVGSAYFEVASMLRLNDIHELLTSYKVRDQWEAMAREVNLDELNLRRRELTASVVRGLEIGDDNACSTVGNWVTRNKSAVSQWQATMAEVDATNQHGFALFAVTLRALSQLSSDC
ncbi:MAG: NAD-glutamate dehydrogenase [Pseudomonadales bacterium]|jgi:glutamate dehydrogenase